MTGELAVFALHARGILEETAAERAAHDIVELLLDELVAILFVHFFLSLPDGTFTVETDVERLLVFRLFDEAHCQMDPADRFERKPRVDKYRPGWSQRSARCASTECSTWRSSCSAIGLAWRRLELNVRSNLSTISHFVCRNPAGGVEFGLNTFASHFLGYV